VIDRPLPVGAVQSNRTFSRTFSVDGFVGLDGTVAQRIEISLLKMLNP